MAILKAYTKKSKGYKGQKPTVSDLHEFRNERIHQHIFNQALFLKNWGGEKVTPSEAVDLIKQKFYQRPQRRDLQPREVENAVAKAFDSSLIRRSPSRKVFIPKQVMTSADSLWPQTLQKLATEEACKDAVSEALEEYHWPVAKMIEQSPIDARNWSTHEILGVRYKPSDLICSGTFYAPKTRSLQDWISMGMQGDLFCPNPMRVEQGINMNGNPSERCRDNVGRRKFNVYECDDTSLDFDAKASLIKCLWDKTGANLRMVVHSGGKSLHAFFDASENEEMNWQFMSLAVKYGGDPDMYRPEQQSRLPNAYRFSKDIGKPLLDKDGNKIRQTCLYLDPQ
jgi:hypothetical protein